MNSIKSRVSSLKEYAQRAAPGASVSTLVYTGEKFLLSCGMWDGKPGTGRNVESEHKTHAEAIDAYHAFLAKHPAKDPIFIDCSTFPEVDT